MLPAKELGKVISVRATGIVLILLLSGCGGERTYHIAGTVTFMGKPVPAGQIVFEPADGNKGGPAFAKIKDGHFDTREEGRGTIGGPHNVMIHGRDGIPRGELLSGLPLFRDYSGKVDLPKKNGEQNFEVPAELAIKSGS